MDKDSSIPIAKFKFEELEIGQKETFQITVTESMINEFANISGDFNPIHTDQEFAKETQFKNKITHGMLLASFFSRIVGMHLPGENSTYLSQSAQFIKPCFPGEKITIQGEITDKSESTRIITLKTQIFNTSNECLVSGEAKVVVR